MRRLIFVVGNCGMIDVGYFIESKLAIKFKIPVTLCRIVTAIAVGGKFPHRFMTRLLMDTIEDSPGAASGNVLQSGIRHSQPAALTKRSMEVAIAAQLRRYPTIFHPALKSLQRTGRKIPDH